MSRWKEFDGTYVDLDEVRSIELHGAGGLQPRAVLMVPGGPVEILLRGDVHLAGRPAYPQGEPWDGPRWMLFRPKVRARWEAWLAENREQREAYRRAMTHYEVAELTARIKAAEEAFDQLVCEIGARDCDEGSTLAANDEGATP